MSEEANRPGGNPPGAAMEGGGFCNRHSALQAAGIARLLPYLEQAARSVEIGDEPVVIADYGSSQGAQFHGTHADCHRGVPDAN